MDFFKRSPILTLLILNFVIFTASGEEENNWDSEDISSKLQDWIRNAENVPFEVQFRWDYYSMIVLKEVYW